MQTPERNTCSTKSATATATPSLQKTPVRKRRSAIPDCNAVAQKLYGLRRSKRPQLGMTEEERIASNLPFELLDGLKGAVAKI